MGYVFLGICLLIGLVLLARWFATANPAQMVTALKWALAVVGVGLAVFFLLTGRLSWALGPLGVVLLFLGRELGRALVQRLMFGGPGGLGGLGGFGAGGRPRRGQSSGVETRYLRVVLDHDSGEMDGTVIEGAFAGRELGSLSLDELMRLLHECAEHDGQSARVLESYLDRREGAGWRERAGARPGRAAGGRMSREEAREILGLEPGASADEVREAHRRLMGKIHPDRGGSTYLAAKINEAKEVLLED